MLRLSVCLALLALLTGCGGGSSAAPAPPPGTTVAVSGQITFDRVPAVTGQGLVYAQTIAQPARGVGIFAAGGRVIHRPVLKS